MDKKVDEAVELVMGMCARSLMTADEALEFLEGVVSRLEAAGDTLAAAEDES